jgi:hypothetical protein
VYLGNRFLASIQNNPKILPQTVFYNPYLSDAAIPAGCRINHRRQWFDRSLSVLHDCDVLFFDPDNGLEVKSAPISHAKACKYVMYEEIAKAYQAGKSLIIYNHCDRSDKQTYMSRFKKIADAVGRPLKFPILRFNRYSVRDYVFVLQPEHQAAFDACLKAFVQGPWGEHFGLSYIDAIVI